MQVSDKPIIEALASWDATVGKTIASVCTENAYYNDTYLVIRFTDGTAALLREHNGESCYDCVSSEPNELGRNWNKHARVYFGLDSLEEYEADERRRKAQYEAANEACERAQYKALKAKYDK